MKLGCENVLHLISTPLPQATLHLGERQCGGGGLGRCSIFTSYTVLDSQDSFWTRVVGCMARLKRVVDNAAARLRASHMDKKKTAGLL